MQNPAAARQYPTLEPRVSLGIHLDYSKNPAQSHSPNPNFPMSMYPHPGQGQQQSPPGQPQYQGPGQQQSYGPPHQQPPQYQNPMNPNRPEMAAPVHPGQPQYLPPPPPGQPGYYQQPPLGYPQQQPQGSPQQQAAPRQRTAIACKYCRRRKIRCSGFEAAADGRCNNCIRFNQECVFTPVSSQTQAFVPAQAVYGRRGPAGGAPPQLYGPYGQPLPPQHYSLPSPMHQGYSPQGYPGYPPSYPPQQYEQQPPNGPGQPGSAAGNRRRRDEDEPHTPTLPQPNPGPNAHLAGNEQTSYGYPEQQSYAGSPATAQHPYQPAQQGFYPGQSQRTSPGSTYSYEQPRASNSPHTGQGYYGQPPVQQNPSAPQANHQGRASPHSADGKNGLAIRDIVSESGPAQGERTAADSDMVSALNRTSRR